MRLFTMIITFLCAVIACFMVNVFTPNGQTAFHMVSRFPVPIAPSPIVLYFWLIVYGALLYWLFVQSKQPMTISAPHAAAFNLAMVAHALTFFSWQQQLFSISVLFASLAPLCLMYMYMTMYPKQHMMRIPLSLCISFFGCLLLWETAFFITYAQWDGLGLSEHLWDIFLLTTALIIGICIRYTQDDPYFLLAFAWLYICIIVEHHIDDIFVSSVALFLCGATCVAMKYARK